MPLKVHMQSEGKSSDTPGKNNSLKAYATLTISREFPVVSAHRASPTSAAANRSQTSVGASIKRKGWDETINNVPQRNAGWTRRCFRASKATQASTPKSVKPKNIKGPPVSMNWKGMRAIAGVNKLKAARSINRLWTCMRRRK